MKLEEEKCVPCHGGTPPVPAADATRLVSELGAGWKLNERGHLERDYRFEAFTPAQKFANALGVIAEREGHHPEMTVGWGHCRVEIWTHAIKGLSRNDFILAAKADKAYASTETAPPTPINVDDFEELARAKLSPTAWAYYSSGAHDEVTLHANRSAFKRLALHYRVLVDVSRRDLSTTVLGERVAFPILVAPTAFHGLAHPERELATARAAAKAGTIFTLSTLATATIDEVRAASQGPIWFQLYVFKDRAATEALVRRAEAAGAKALVLTVDAPLLGRRERDVRNRFQLPPGLCVKNLVPEGMSDLPAEAQDSGLAAYFASLLDPALGWRDLAWLRSITKLPLLVKGIVRKDDARRAVDEGAQGIVVSNHGGRQLDTAPATIDVLSGIVDEVGGRAEVLLDGGVRRGTDAVKALALGARAVLVGRPILWGLAVGGEQGVSAVLEILRTELDLALALSGCASVAAVTRDLLSGS
jgi:4-hydroxymandelate oxidase